jgi:PAS domain S-box-containing protein
MMARRPADASARISVGLVGGGKGGAALLDLLLDWPAARVAVVADLRTDAPALGKARALGIPTAARHLDVFAYPVTLILEATGDPRVLEDLLRAKPVGVEVIGAGSLRFFWDLLEDRARPTRQLQAQLDMALALGSTLQLDQQAVIVARTLARACDVDRCSIVFFDEETGYLTPIVSQLATGQRSPRLAAAFRRLRRLKREDVPFFREIAERRTPIEIMAPASDPLVPRGWAERFGLQSFLVIPILRHGQVVGACVLDYCHEPHRFTQDQIALATTLGGQVSLAFENAILYQRAEQRAAKLTALSELTQLMTSATGSQEAVDTVARAATTLLGATTTRVWVDDPVAQVLRTQGSFGLDREIEAMMTDFPVLPYGQGGVGRVFESRAPLYILDISQDPRWLNRRIATDGGIHGFVGLPLKAGNRVLGVLAILFRDERHFTPEERELMGLLADQAAIAIHNARLFDEIARGRREAEALAELAQERNEKLHGLIYASPLPITALKPDGTVEIWNAAAERVFGWRAEEVLGQPLPMVPRDQEAEFQDLFGRGLRGEPLIGIEVRRQRKDGSFVDVSLSTASLHGANGDIVGMLGIMVDVTERKQLEEQVRQSQKMDAIGQLAAGVAHDFSNLLTVIQGRSELLQRRLGADDAAQRDLELIRTTAARAAAVTRQLLAFSRKQLLQPRILNLNARVAEMAVMLRQLIGEHIDLVTRLDPALGSVNADPAQLEQVILNLMVNARDAMPDGGRLTLTTANVEGDEILRRHQAAATAGPYVQLTVSDTGVGMDPATQARIFEPFFTTKPSGEGTGLGLSTVYGIVKQHGGHVSIESAPGQGSTFTVYLPLLAQAAETIEVGPADTEAARGCETVLLVEDEAAVRSMARDVLELSGYTVLEAANGEAALGVAKEHRGPIHVLLTDVVMPGMNGRMLADRLVRMRPDLKVLYMSGYTNDAVLRCGVVASGLGWLEKPFTSDGVARKLRQVLEAPVRG